MHKWEQFLTDTYLPSSSFKSYKSLNLALVVRDAILRNENVSPEVHWLTLNVYIKILLEKHVIFYRYKWIYVVILQKYGEAVWELIMHCTTKHLIG